MEELVDLLKTFECHFNWRLDELNALQDSFVAVKDRVATKIEEVSGQLWIQIVLKSILCYEETKISPTSSDQNLYDCMRSLASDQDPFVKKHRRAFENVLYAFKAHVAFLNSTVSKAKELASKVVPFSELTSEEKAAVMGFKASVILEYGKNGTIASLEFARKAVKYDPTEAEWHFIVGKVLQRIRNFTLDKTPSDEERASLEKAFEMSKAPQYAIFLSTCLWNTSRSIYYGIPLQNGQRTVPLKETEQMNALNRRCVELFECAAKGNPDCPHNLIRVARGFYDLPKELKNLPYAQKLAEECLEKAPENPMVNIVAAQIYRALGENEKAIKLAEKGGDLGAYGGYMRLFELKIASNQEFDVEAFYRMMLSKFSSPLDIGKTYLHATCFYLFVKEDRLNSFEYFKKALEVDYDLSEIIKKMYVNWIRDNINLYDVMYNEALLRIERLTEEFGGDHQNLKTPRYLAFKIAMASSSSTERQLDPFLVKRLIDNSKYNRGGTNRGRGRGCGRGGRGGNVSVSVRANHWHDHGNERSVRGQNRFRQNPGVNNKGGSNRLNESCESSDNWRHTNNARQRSSSNSLEVPVRSNSWQETSNRVDPTKTSAEHSPKFDLNSPRAKFTLDELRKAASSTSNLRRSDLIQALRKNMKTDSIGSSPSSTEKGDMVQSAEPFTRAEPGNKLPVPQRMSIAQVRATIKNQNLNPEAKPPSPLQTTEKGLRADSEEVAQLRAAIMEQMANLNTGTKAKTSSLKDSSLQILEDSSLSSSSEAANSNIPQAGDVLSSFIKRKFTTQDGDNSSSDESRDSD